jgi:hypothetical protein
MRDESLIGIISFQFHEGLRFGISGLKLVKARDNGETQIPQAYNFTSSPLVPYSS